MSKLYRCKTSPQLTRRGWHKNNPVQPGCCPKRSNSCLCSYNPMVPAVQGHLFHHWCGEQKKHHLTGASSAGTGWNKDFSITRVPCLLYSWPDRPFGWQGEVNLLTSAKLMSCGGGISIYCRYYIKGTNLVYRCHQQLNMDWRLREISWCQSQNGILQSARNPSACHIVLVDLKIWIASVVT